MKKKHIVALVIAAAFIGIAAFALVENKIDYSDFTYARTSGKRVQVSGTHNKDLPTEYNAANNMFTFTMTDHKGVTMPVRYNGLKPTNFELSTNVVLVGKIEDGVFVASEIQTKCPSRYEGSDKVPQ
jgi:cytochrome c-type biogenesis protein CcmE